MQEFNDGSMWRVVSDPSAQVRERQVYCHRAATARDGVPYVDPTFAAHRDRLAEMPALLFYQYVWQNAGTPEAQADFLVRALGRLRVNEMVMLDIEEGGKIADPVDFARRWLAVVEGKLRTLAWVYVPRALSGFPIKGSPEVPGGLTRAVTGNRIVMAPHYSAVPWWPHDVHQYTDTGYFPGCAQTGDVSRTALTTQQMLRRCNPLGISCECSEGATRDA